MPGSASASSSCSRVTSWGATLQPLGAAGAARVSAGRCRERRRRHRAPRHRSAIHGTSRGIASHRSRALRPCWLDDLPRCFIGPRYWLSSSYQSQHPINRMKMCSNIPPPAQLCPPGFQTFTRAAEMLVRNKTLEFSHLFPCSSSVLSFFSARFVTSAKTGLYWT